MLHVRVGIIVFWYTLGACIRGYVILSVQIVAVGPDVPSECALGKRVCVENHFFCGHCYQCTHGMICSQHLVTPSRCITVQLCTLTALRPDHYALRCYWSLALPEELYEYLAILAWSPAPSKLLACWEIENSTSSAMPNAYLPQ